MKFIKPFRGALSGEAFPTAFAVGDDCPAELLDAALAVGAVEKEQLIKPTGKRERR